MRIKLAENLPGEARAAAMALGHDVETVLDEALGGAGDHAVLAAASREDRLLVTLDRGFGDVRRYPPGSHRGIAIIRVEPQDAPTVTAAVTQFLSNEGLGDLTGCLVVVRGRLIRVRRPEEA